MARRKRYLDISLLDGELIRVPIKEDESAGEIVAGLNAQGGIWRDMVLIPWHRVHRVEIVEDK